MTGGGWFAIGVTRAIFIGLQRRGAPVDLLFLGGLVAVTLAGVITPQQALAGFANEAVLTIGALYAAVTGLRHTGVLDQVGERLLGGVHEERVALRRLAAAVLPVSAFVLNTPMVVMMMPVVIDWCRKHHVSPSRMLMPLSYLTILGGVCTLIGTSTTLVVNGWLKRVAAEEAWDEAFRSQISSMGLFDMGWVGLPCAVVGTIYMLTIAPRWLPNRSELVEQLGEHRREYLVEMRVQRNCPLIGKSVELAGLRHLPGLFLIEIDREGDLITPVAPHDTIRADDRLVFTGVVTTIADLEKIPGLVPEADTSYEFRPQERLRRQLTEVVLSRTSPVIGISVRDANFRRRYGAAIVAVHRNGARLRGKIGDVELEPGDTLLLQTRTSFLDHYRHSPDFYLVSPLGGSSARRHDRAWLAALLFAGLIVWLSVGRWLQGFEWLGGFGSSAIASITVAGIMVVSRCLPVAQARSAVDLHVLLTIAGALGVAESLKASGAAREIAVTLVDAVQGIVAAGLSAYVLLVVFYILTWVFTEMITNVAVATMLLPIAMEAAWTAGVNPRPFVMAIALAASLSFITPIGYQTNLMVMGPGGYEPRDYLRVGTPLSLLVNITALVLLPWMWPLYG
jgi:di/tricarboxylate transporter